MSWSDLMEEIKPQSVLGSYQSAQNRGYTLYPTQKPDNSVAIDDAEIAECLAYSIETQCSHASPPHDIAHISRIEEEVLQKTSLEPKDDLAPVSLSEVQTLVKSLNTRKAPGLDGIHKPGNHATSCQLQTDQPPERHSCPQQVLRLVEYVSEALKPNNSTVAVFFDVAKAFDGMSALTRQDVLSEQEFLKAPPSLLCCTPRTQTIYRDRRRLASNSRYSRTIPRSFTDVGIGAPDSPSSPQRAIDELGQWFRKWRIEVNPDKSAAIQFKDLELPTISKYMKDASKRFFDIAGSHPNALLRAAVDYQPPHPYLIRRPRNVLTDPPDALTAAVESYDVNDTHD
ncbi:hypothetical protein EVAR_78527_1 [Eumeta japonica]|uniref:Uncharacterized protein n=1 Tax=Eumeta variegata TaxID=151549 RepID=A0A4C1ZWA4_EUMVA|nr:hypothetical protein EVAR_78527_1 [Eumeta japonica]